jgi:hypothetical protein
MFLQIIQTSSQDTKIILILFYFHSWFISIAKHGETPCG